MPKMTQAVFEGKLISIDEGLALRTITTRGNRPRFICDECGERVRAHKSGGHAGAHFEHHKRNPSCSQSDHLRT
jgi:hypothetical protein